MKFKNRSRHKATKHFIRQWSRKNHKRNIIDEVLKEEFHKGKGDEADRFLKKKFPKSLARKYCKRLKGGRGGHEFEIVDKILFEKVVWKEKICKMCGRKEFIFAR